MSQSHASVINTTVVVLLSAALAVSLLLHAWNPFVPHSPDPPSPPSPPTAGTPELDSELAPEPERRPPQSLVPGQPEPAPEIEPEIEPELEPEPDPRIAALDAAFDAAQALPGLQGAAIGFCLLDGSGQVLYERHARTAQIPASTLKTLTTAAALEILGHEFRFETVLGFAGSRAGETIEGDLILLGGGDPTLVLSDLAAWAADLADTGVQSISGRVIGDGRLFAGSVFPDFWDWGDIGNGYGSPVSGLNLERNRFVATFSGGDQEGAPAELLGIEPKVPGVTWWNHVLTGPPGSGDGVMIYGGERAAVMHLRGTVPPMGNLRVRGAVPDPERFVAHHLREALTAVGIEVAGDAVAAAGLLHEGGDVPEIVEDIRRHQSPPLADIVTSIHASSDNHETECLYRTLGVREGLPPDVVLRAHWAGRGLDFAGLRMVDGSGLARAGHITPHDLALVQHLAATGPSAEIYLESLLLLPVADGALRIKPGAMSAVRGYTGLALPASGEQLSFALMINHFSDPSSVAALRNALFEVMANW